MTENEIQKWSTRKLYHEALSIYSKPDSLERQSVFLAVSSFLFCLILGAVGYFSFWANLPNFWPSYGWFLALLLVGWIPVSATAWYVRQYLKVSCSVGMMIGMALGMLSGFWVGLMLGLTNGMLVATLVGTVTGFLVGAWTGKCCGWMGVLEGLMAGFMAGPMGAMTAIMMINDNYWIYFGLALVLLVAMLLGLKAMTRVELGNEHVRRASAKQDWLVFAMINFIVLLAFALIMIYGPKSALIAVPVA